MSKLLRSKKDARLYFKLLSNTELEGNMDIHRLKTILIRLGYIELVDLDRYVELRRLGREALPEIAKENEKLSIQ